MIILIFQPGTSDLGEVKTFALVASGRATNGGVNETRRWESVQVREHVARGSVTAQCDSRGAALAWGAQQVRLFNKCLSLGLPPLAGTVLNAFATVNSTHPHHHPVK